MLTMNRLLLVMLAAVALPAHANWYLDNESSRLSFTSTKNTDIAEVHRFLVLHGKVDAKGLAEVQVETDSISTGIPLRDERLREQVFQVRKFPAAQINAQLDMRPINALAPGAQLELRLPLTVSLRGKTHSYNAELLATRLDERRFQVVTLEPLVLHAQDFDMVPDFNGLRGAAGLSAISLSVPVGAVLIFTAR
ncbi:YceI family protein [Pseudomonas syringae pv. tagetis]|uniref:YceI n=2 Tax=Pseudomonas syringae group genomosp. 7 TaxID=251699 RepID=A0A0Q0B1H5_9PSED|nr:YceI family protein [Pseudomonas syringae group genomosp. 7]KPX45491.1 YceI [Pseudomonas syringae pv. helianthi]KPY82117.1 YceI [Pseudomonas syringae pv. tagetis]RMV50659.1 YceI [Pseudomonas syringae pv. helianthi]RMW21025.1 YceI [Pseudomonas syringae pv. tagetis]UNB64375.1 YceI family protein [Pseudomonas syringae pv. helianthi]